MRKVQNQKHFSWNTSKSQKIKQENEARPKSNSIYLFGEFTVYNLDNGNITYLFSKKLKETFCLLLQSTQEGGGISSVQLGHLLWPDRQSQQLKNIKNVTLNRLRKILDEIDGIELLYDKGLFTLTLQYPVYCDYIECMTLLSNTELDPKLKEFTDIIKRGKFLENTNDPFYDSLKEKTEKRIEPFIIHKMQESIQNEKWQDCIEFAQAALHIDPMNELAIQAMIKAMKKLDMHEAARLKYLSFLIDYKKVMGKDYPNSF